MTLVRQIRNMNIIQSAATHRSGPGVQQKLFYPAADRNKEPILSVLRQYICSGPNQNLLEISSGTGQHVAHFAAYFPQVTFYPSEVDSRLLESISNYTKSFANVKPPFLIDISTDYSNWGDTVFEESNFDYIYNCNMVHISPFPCSIGLFKNTGKLLKKNGILFTYGPYMIDGKISPESNVSFNESLKTQNPEWGLRDVRDLEKLAHENGIYLMKIIDMPANNKTIIWRKE
ncbi:methyltransferase-like 26 [Athalia rosae]|uniref:methyltransferase-like 26 n=1 Tax=Athalia rosae TaxID=37344 RepID=UPI0006255559|nr:methyltransferase-like 26 [Athalia rosae]XP_020708689.1 methyltransferase-like 26 [Athalia rosae]